MSLSHSARALLPLLALPAVAVAQRTPALPLKHAPQPTKPVISAADLMTRLYIFADDSMQGRESGTVGHLKSTQYIADELKRLGLKPAGDDGSYFQKVPFVSRTLDVASDLAVDGTPLRALVDYVPQAGRGGGGASRSLAGAQAIFGGTFGDTTVALTPDQIAGKVVVVVAPTRNDFAIMRRGMAPFAGAAAVVTVVGDSLPANVVAAAARSTIVAAPSPNAAPRGPAGPTTLIATRHAAELLLGASLDGTKPGTLGKTLSGAIRYAEADAPARNVVAILPGRDPKLRNEYVAIGAHNDHIGFGGNPVDHDSLHLYNQARFAIVGMVPRGQQQTAEQQGRVRDIRVDLDSVRKVRHVRLDSIRNGADDDGSGSVTVLELAEAFAKAPVKPKRSILFVWHTGEEKGLIGSRFVTDHLPVPADSIVAQLNMDMVGRGAAQDIPGGGPTYLQLVGSRRLSTELGDLVESVNKSEKMPFAFDYQFDANGHPENIYCRSDHYNYARIGIPIVFFTTGLHGDYHQVTDEPQYIDYPHMARVGQLVYDVATKVANLDHRVVVDHAKPDPNGRCQQ